MTSDLEDLVKDWEENILKSIKKDNNITGIEIYDRYNNEYHILKNDWPYFRIFTQNVFDKNITYDYKKYKCFYNAIEIIIKRYNYLNEFNLIIRDTISNDGRYIIRRKKPTILFKNWNNIGEPIPDPHFGVSKFQFVRKNLDITMNYKCPVCLEHKCLLSLIKIKCGNNHFICNKCYHSLKNMSNQTCPLCRGEL